MPTERLISLNAGENEYIPNSRANVIMFFAMGTGSVYAGIRSGVSASNYEAYANSKRWGWVARPFFIERLNFYVAAATNVIIVEYATEKPFEAMAAQSQEGQVQVTSLPALAAGNNLVGKFGIDQVTPGANGVQLLGSITDTATSTTVGVTTTQVLAANANRKYASFQNDSDTVIYLKISSNAVLNQGIRLNSNGGVYEMSINAGNLDTRAVNAISSASGKNLLVREGI